MSSIQKKIESENIISTEDLRMSENTFTQKRIDKALQRTSDFWNARSSEPMVTVYNMPSYRQEQDPDRMVSMALECIRKDAAGGAEEILPCFWPDFGTVSTAAIWGGKIIPAPPGGCIHIEPFANTVADLAKLKPAPFEKTDYQRAIDLYRRVAKQYGGTLFTRTPDFQGPMNTLSLVMDQTEMMCAFYEKPEAIHAALDHITDILIEYVKRYIETIGREFVVGNIWPFVSLPATMGVAITQDYMPLLGPEAYAEFEIPRLKRIADAFGGVWIHCCGVYEQHLKTLSNGNFKIWGLELAYPQMKPQDVYDIFGNDIAYLVGVSPDGEHEFPNIVSYAKHLSKQPCSKGRFWFASCNEWVDARELREVVKSGFGK